MEISKLASRVPIFPLFIAVSLLVGWLIPGFYAWDRLRPEPAVAAAVEGAALVGDCVRGVMYSSAVVANHEQVVE